MAYLVARPRQGVRVPVLRWAGSGRVVGPVQGIGGVCCVKKNGRWFARNPYRPEELCPTVIPPPGVQGLGVYYHTMPGGDVCRCGPPGMQGLGGRILPKVYYPETLEAVAAARTKIRQAQAALETEKERISRSWALDWDSLDPQEIYVSGPTMAGQPDQPLISKEGQDDIFLILKTLDDLDALKKNLYAKALKDNGVLPSEKGTTDVSSSAYYTAKEIDDAAAEAVPTLRYWKWYEFQHSTPTNLADKFDAWVRSGLPSLPKIPDIPQLPGSGDMILYGIIGVVVLLWVTGK